ncbi:hypothetical protein [Streptomyces antimycoticus]
MAALVGIPATVITAAVSAAAAYAGARAQARGAHRGPVDAIRRQHQRDAYAAFLEAASTYSYETQWRRNHVQARTEFPVSGDPGQIERVRQRARELRLEAAQLIDPLRRTLPVVQLEGPEYVADLAQDLFRAAIYVLVDARAAVEYDEDRQWGEPRIDQRLADRITAYTTAARDYLNGSPVPAA